MKKRTLFLLLSFLMVSISFMSCSSSDRQKDKNVNITTISTAADGLDLKSVGEIVKKVKNAEEFEKELNKEGGVNNLDLNEDGNVDYINVTEYGNETSKGFSLSVELSKGDKQEIATIEIDKNNNNEGEMHVTGNQQIYGNNAHYRSSITMTDVLLMHYLFSMHRPYVSPYYYGYYPSYYRSYSVAPYSTYKTRTAAYTKSSTIKKSANNTRKSSITSPNRGKTSSKIKAPLKNPSKSQKSFQARNPSKQVKSGGFGKKSSTKSSSAKSKKSSNRKTSSRKTSSYKRRSSGFGSSRRRSFGGSRRRSDLMFKGNISVIDNATEKLMQIDGVTYNWRVDEYPEQNFSNKKQIGIIAQDVEKVFPEIVFEEKEGFKTVDYESLIPVLIESIKEQNYKIDSLNNEIIRLKQ